MNKLSIIFLFLITSSLFAQNKLYLKKRDELFRSGTLKTFFGLVSVYAGGRITYEAATKKNAKIGMGLASGASMYTGINWIIEGVDKLGQSSNLKEEDFKKVQALHKKIKKVSQFQYENSQASFIGHDFAILSSFLDCADCTDSNRVDLLSEIYHLAVTAVDLTIEEIEDLLEENATEKNINFAYGAFKLEQSINQI